MNNALFHCAKVLEVPSLHFLRIAIFLVMAWIGGLKVVPYEAEGIVPFVANSPLMSFFYRNANDRVLNEAHQPVPAYTLHRNPEGKIVQKNKDWHHENGTYTFSYMLGAVIVSIGILVLLGIWFPKVGVLGGVLTVLMSLVTLSFLVTTPEVYVPNLGGDGETLHHGFPYLSGAGRLVLKDVIMMAAGLVLCLDGVKRCVAARGCCSAASKAKDGTSSSQEEDADCTHHR